MTSRGAYFRAFQEAYSNRVSPLRALAAALGLSRAARVVELEGDGFREAFEDASSTRTSSFRAVVAALALPRTARVLELACGGDGFRTIGEIADLFDHPIVGLGHRPRQAEALIERFGDRVNLQSKEPRNFHSGAYDLVVVNSGLAGTAVGLTRMLEVAARVVGPDGFIVLYTVMRTRMKGAPAPGLSRECLAVLDPFFETNFGSFEPSIEEMLAPAAAYGLAPEAVVSAGVTPDLGVTAWVVLRRGSAGSTKTQGYRSADKRFPLGKTVSWLASMNRVARVVFPDEFCEIAKEHPPEASGSKSTTQRVIVLKHDIHHDLRRTVEMAEAEAKAGIYGVYLMMGPHELNETFFDQRETWDRLRHIDSLGHRLGLHLDIVDTIRKFGDLYEGIAYILERFKRENLEVRYGSSHGNTRLKHVGFRASHAFRELAPRNSAAVVTSEFHDHVGRYSLEALASRFGVEYWLDSTIRHRGEAAGRATYISDNTGALVAPRFRSPEFDLDDEFIQAARVEAEQTNLLLLLHPQYYDARAQSPTGAAGSRRGEFRPTRHRQIPSIRLEEQDYTDFSVTVEGLRYDGRLNTRVTGRHMYAAFHGGVRGAKSFPVLPRWTQHALLQAPILSLFDPLIYEHPHIPGGWYVGDAARDATHVIAQLILHLGEQLGLPRDRIICIGNSSGGFAAMRVAAEMGGARFIAVNSQTVITNYFPRGVEPFSNAFDPSRSPEENEAAYPQRWSAIETIADARRRGVDVRGVIIQNTADKHHYEDHVQAFCGTFGIPVAGGSSSDGKLSLVLYEGEPGHGPEPAPVARRIAAEYGPSLAGLGSSAEGGPRGVGVRAPSGPTLHKSC